MSPGSVTELLDFFTAEFAPNLKVAKGGGVEDEKIETIETPFATALAMIAIGESKNAKTIILLQCAALHALIPLAAGLVKLPVLSLPKEQEW